MWLALVLPSTRVGTSGSSGSLSEKGGGGLPEEELGPRDQLPCHSYVGDGALAATGVSREQIAFLHSVCNMFLLQRRFIVYLYHYRFMEEKK